MNQQKAFGIAQHLLGRRVDGITHMCPAVDCGYPPQAFCPTCLGTGLVDEAQLDRWQREETARMYPKG